MRIFEPSEWAVGTVRLGVLVSRRRRRPQPQGGRRTRVFGQRASKSSESSGSASRNRPASKWRQSSMAKPRASFRLVGATSTMVTAQRRSFPAFVSPLPPARSSQHLQQRLRLRTPAPRPSSRPLREAAFAKEARNRLVRHLLGLAPGDSEILQQVFVQAEQLLPFAVDGDNQSRELAEPPGCMDESGHAPCPRSSADDDSLARCFPCTTPKMAG